MRVGWIKKYISTDFSNYIKVRFGVNDIKNPCDKNVCSYVKASLFYRSQIQAYFVRSSNNKIANKCKKFNTFN